MPAKRANGSNGDFQLKGRVGDATKTGSLAAWQDVLAPVKKAKPAKARR
jgi:hypothetical protein